MILFPRAEKMGKKAHHYGAVYLYQFFCDNIHQILSEKANCYISKDVAKATEMAFQSIMFIYKLNFMCKH